MASGPYTAFCVTDWEADKVISSQQTPGRRRGLPVWLVAKKAIDRKLIELTTR